ncbi:pyruvate flavodoxin oxidoreductase subunit gamma [Helicobacter winghamensis]|uniref:Pyruvate ferredoxin oxidoreductase n=1 Tax=Helicobacter winghamensis TaxID=157268 RepID=A0A2N3PJ95_9HELI|nr:pyruvate flavodoxin oxidoreductase subunit gamma [Helicobacter winghamensis]EEO25404.1 pyruvate flavodoxin oxidoreductase subunit gamma [Helicobacter winghamensis ATCC BAA-430]PKT78162.1 pyruvate ferredoxin oxidoreductase [Helicobacter winghamensis]PKT78430.1 pyruvate ferredoxin oxidoreductase [Helicobacter winghamensis]PKT78691.1 pyruvate ferredoxin oxidoreductase [Helicobacter winghamensis]PKT80461.1 pyruvate ferredoxin oxidoreductase [Helicobacter winghamensis]
MLEIRWHSRAGQGAVTGAKGLADVIAGTGKEVQAFAFYGSAKRGAAMTAYNRIDDNPILNHEKFMNPDYILVIDPGLVYITDICANAKETTKYIITTHLSKEEFLESKPELKSKEVYILDCIGLSLEAFGKSIPNAPMLGAFLKISGALELDFFLESFKKVLGKKLPQKVIDANMEVIKKAYDAVK